MSYSAIFHAPGRFMFQSLASFRTQISSAWRGCLSPFALLCAVLTLPLPAIANDAGDAFTVQGFGTLGAVRTTSDDVEFVRDLSQPRGATTNWDAGVDSVFGLQVDWRVSDDLHVVAQGISRYRYDRSFHPDLAWAFIKYDPVPNLSLRAGRLGTEFFMLADSRWVGYSFLTVRPPGDFFWYLPFYAIHGADAALSVPVGEDVLRGKVFYGRSTGKIPLADQQWEIDGSPMVGGYLEYQSGPWQVRGSYANIKFEHDLPISEVIQPVIGRGLTAPEAAFLKARDTRTHYYSLGVVYDQGPWQAQLMLNHIEQGSQALESSDGGYLQVGYRVGDITPYLGYSRVRSKVRNNPLNPVAAYVMSDSHSAQWTAYGGMRWDVARNTALKLQWDSIHGDPTSLFPYRRDDRAHWSGRMDVFSVALDFVF